MPRRIMRDPIHAPCPNQGNILSAANSPSPSDVPTMRILLFGAMVAVPITNAFHVETVHVFPSSAERTAESGPTVTTVQARRPFSGSFQADAEYTKLVTVGDTFAIIEWSAGQKPKKRMAKAAKKATANHVATIRMAS